MDSDLKSYLSHLNSLVKVIYEILNDDGDQYSKADIKCMLKDKLTPLYEAYPKVIIKNPKSVSQL